MISKEWIEELRELNEKKNVSKTPIENTKNWIDELYLEIKAHWNRIRAEGGQSDECRFLVHLMEEIERNTDDTEAIMPIALT